MDFGIVGVFAGLCDLQALVPECLPQEALQFAQFGFVQGAISRLDEDAGFARKAPRLQVEEHVREVCDKVKLEALHVIS
jgi:hypothetical protein